MQPQTSSPIQPSAAVIALLQTLYARHYRFMTVTPATHQRVNQRPENAWANSLQDIFGWNRPFVTGTLEAAWLAQLQRHGLVVPAHDGWRSTIRVSSLPVGAHPEILLAHSAYPTNDTEAVFFGPDTYRFIHAMRQALPRLARPPVRCVDIGTGTGAAALALARCLPEAEIWGVDLNQKALEIAAANAHALALPQVHFAHSNLLQALHGTFDLIVANPPYLVDPLQRTYRHGSGPLGAQLSLEIVEAACQRLAPGGTLMLYTGVAIVDGHDAFIAAVQPRLQARQMHYEYDEIDPDIFADELMHPPYDQADRIAAVWLQVQNIA
ncbi:methyltransferase [Methylophilus sp. 3sh_L]|uniref:methyltransferase n=1 Tax=Methylophilus sp. 3sh_L TaxID=3377114 RepID=UPI00398E4C38